MALGSSEPMNWSALVMLLNKQRANILNNRGWRQSTLEVIIFAALLMHIQSPSREGHYRYTSV